MKHPRILRPFHRMPDPQHFEDLDRLGEDISQLAAHITAATFHLLELIAIFDEQKGWARHGARSCAHWLQWKCGTNLGAAREKVRVARALPELPQISAAFRAGRVSYSKVRAMTRVATWKNEETLLNIARHGTAAHVETIVRRYRRCKRNDLLREENRRHLQRELSWGHDGDGMWTLHGRFTAEQGALIRKALEQAMDDLQEETADEHPHVTAAAPGGSVADYERPRPAATRRADALERVAQAFLAGARGEHSGGDRYLIHIHTEPDVLTRDGGGVSSECEEHDHVCAEASRRMACDATTIRWQGDEHGEPLNIGRKSRTIPAAIRRALQRRDGGCRFPGCSCRRFVDAHHIHHWADGGATSMDNLVLLCRRHHRLVHEGGFGVHRQPGGEIRFTYPDARDLPDSAAGRFRGNAAWIEALNRSSGLEITAQTLPPKWLGERMDSSIVIEALYRRE